MDINWLDPAGRGSQASELVENIALFLSKLAEPPDRAPVVVSVPDEDPGTEASSIDRPPTGAAATG
jgi:hypothetical protein